MANSLTGVGKVTWIGPEIEPEINGEYEVEAINAVLSHSHDNNSIGYARGRIHHTGRNLEYNVVFLVPLDAEGYIVTEEGAEAALPCPPCDGPADMTPLTCKMKTWKIDDISKIPRK